MKKISLIFILFSLLLSCNINGTGNENPDANLPDNFVQSDQIKDQNGNSFLYIDEEGNFVSSSSSYKGGTFYADDENDPSATASADAGNENQPRDFEEADVFKITENRLYLANVHRGLLVLDISNPLEPSIMGRIRMQGRPYELYEKDGKIILMLDNFQDDYTQCAVQILSFQDSRFNIDQEILLEGQILDSRMADSILYLVSNQYSWYSYDEDSTQAEEAGNQSKLYSIDMNSASIVDEISLPGNSPAIHVSDNYLFAAVNDDYWVDQNSTTTISSFDLSDTSGNIRPSGEVSFTGYIHDRFKLNYFQGHLRAVAYDYQQQSTKVYSFSWQEPNNPKLQGSVELAPGERLFATRFAGNYAYVVTYLQVDPLFIVDFTNPGKPRIVGELGELPGWSDHIEILGDRLFALGTDDQSGWNVKAAYYDVSDKTAPRLLDEIILGSSYSYSSAAWDYKRLCYLPKNNAYAIPFSSWDQNHQHQNSTSLIKLTDNSIEEYVCLPQSDDIVRSMEIDLDKIYIYSNTELRTYQINGKNDYSLSKNITIAENINSIIPLNQDQAIKISSPNWSKKYLKSFDLADYSSQDCLSSIETADSWFSIQQESSLLYQNRLYYLSNSYENGQYSIKLNIIDVSDPVNLRKVKTITLKDNSYYYSYYNQKIFQHLKENYYGLRLGSYWQVLDFSQADSPSLVNEIETSSVLSILQDNKKLYVNRSEFHETQDKNNYFYYYITYKLDCYNISDPRNISLESEIKVPGQVLGKDSKGHFLCYYNFSRINANGDYQYSDHLVSFSVNSGKALLLDAYTLQNPLYPNSVYQYNDNNFLVQNAYYFSFYYDTETSRRNNPEQLELATFNLDADGQIKKGQTIQLDDELYSSLDFLDYQNKTLIISRSKIHCYGISGNDLLFEKGIDKQDNSSYDFTIIGDYLYQSAGFKGIFRYNLAE